MTSPLWWTAITLAAVVNVSAGLLARRARHRWHARVAQLPPLDDDLPAHLDALDELGRRTDVARRLTIAGATVTAVCALVLVLGLR